MRLIGLVVLSMLVTAGAAQAASVERGRQTVTRNCAVCHAVGPLGASRNPQAPPFRELHTRYPVEMLSESLAEGILTGHPAMPEFRFTVPEIEDIVAYLQSLQNRARGWLKGPGGKTRHQNA